MSAEWSPLHDRCLRCGHYFSQALDECPRCEASPAQVPPCRACGASEDRCLDLALADEDGAPGACCGACDHGDIRQGGAVAAPTLPTVPLSDDEARELSRAAKQVTSWTERRNTLIRGALAAGHGVREVARATGLAPATVLNIQKPKQRKQT